MVQQQQLLRVGPQVDLLEQVGVVVTPGTGYGPSGEGYIRLSLTISDDNLAKGLARLAAWKSKKS